MHRKAVKQLDKLTQWTGEKFLKGDKTELADEFKDFEKEAELRRRGFERLHATAAPFHASLAKRKPTADPYPAGGASKDKLLAGEAMGLAMISHGEDVLRAGVGERTYGEQLQNFGRARCKVAMAQEEFTNRLEAGYMASMEAGLETVKEYMALRKKLDSRRLALDAANRKLATAKKDHRTLEMEVQLAQERFEETQEELYSRMTFFQEGEKQQLVDLTDFLDAELDFVAKYYEILRDLKTEWTTGATPTSATRPRSKSTSAVPRTTQSAVPARLSSRPPLPHRTSTSSMARNTKLPQSSDEEYSDAAGRARSQSNASNSSGKTRLGLGAIVPSFGRSKSGQLGANGKKYGSLRDEEEELRRDDHDEERHDLDSDDEGDDAYSREVTRTPTAARTAPAQQRVRALYDFAGSAADELPLRTGDVVTVTQIVSSDWYIGNNEDGDSGLFPASYTEPYHAPPPAARPPPATRTLPPPIRNTPPAQQYRSTLPASDLSSTTEGESDDAADYQPTARMVPTGSTSSTLSAKKNKPPPPPISRRSTAQSSSTSVSAHGSPARPPSTFEASPGASRMILPAGRPPSAMKRGTSSQGGSAVQSPFGGSEDEDELGGQGLHAVAACRVCGCDDFAQNVFKSAGTCNSCFHAH